ncbi:MAG: preprotein translocase subunit YajC [bacterium]
MNVVMAQAAPAAGAQGAGGLIGFIVPMAIIFAIFYFMIILPQKRKDKERKKLIENIKSGDRVIFSGGMIGAVANVKDNVLVVKIAENVKVEIVRGAVLKVLDKGAEPTDIDAR